jgi:hypothetical protein
MKRTLLALAAVLIASSALAAGNFTGLPAATSPGTVSVGAPTTGGGPITPGGCIPMDTGNVSGINPATMCVSPSQLDLWGSGVQLSYSTAQVPGSVPLASLGNDTTPVSGTIYLAQLILPVNFTITNIACLNGSAAATDKYVYGLYNQATGALLASTALAGVTASGANAFQAVIPLTAPYAAAAGSYLVALQANGTTTRFRTITAAAQPGWIEASQTGVFGTLPTLSPVPSTFTANVGPICFVN